jgi:hypothetical protein
VRHDEGLEEDTGAQKPVTPASDSAARPTQKGLRQEPLRNTGVELGGNATILRVATLLPKS